MTQLYIKQIIILSLHRKRIYTHDVLLLFCTDIDACIIDPCENGATCNDGVNAYTCTCAAGYTGDKCETGMLDYRNAVDFD